MPGNHKRIRKAKAKKAEKRRSSSDQSVSSRKSSATEETGNLGAVGGSTFETESSDSSSPVKCDDEFNTEPFRDFVVSVGDSLENEVNDAIEALKIKLEESDQNDDTDSNVISVDENFTSSHVTIEEQTVLLQQLRVNDDTEMGSSMTTHVAQPEEDTANLTTPDKHLSSSKGGDSLGSIVQHDPRITCKNSSDYPQTVGESKDKNVQESGSSVDPPSYEQCDLQRELSLRVEAVDVKSIPTGCEGHISLEEAPVMKFNDISNLSQAPKTAQHHTDVNIIQDTPLSDVINVGQDETDIQHEAAVDTSNEDSEPVSADCLVEGDVSTTKQENCILDADTGSNTCVSNAPTQNDNLRLTETANPEQTYYLETVLPVVETTTGIPDEPGVSRTALQSAPKDGNIVPGSACFDAHEHLALHRDSASNRDSNTLTKATDTRDPHKNTDSFGSDDMHTRALGFTVSDKPIDSVHSKSHEESVTEDTHARDTSQSTQSLPYEVTDPASALSPDQIDIVTTYIDRLFEACFDPDMTGRDSVDLDRPEATDAEGEEARRITPSDPGIDPDQGTPGEDEKEEDIEDENISSNKQIIPENENDIISDKPEVPAVRLESVADGKLTSTEDVSEDAQVDTAAESTPVRNLPDVVSSSTDCVIDRKGLPLGENTQWRSCLIYLSQVYNIYKLLEALYNSMCVAFRDRMEDKDQDVTSRVVLQCKGSRLTGAAIQSLDSLNDQIVQYIFAQNNVDLDLEKDLSPRERETLKSSMVLIRGLLIDAQSKFRKMVDDNRQLAVKIDGSIQAANQEVNVLRAELADTNKRLSQITLTNDLKVDKATQSEVENSVRHKSDEENELTKMKEENVRLEVQVKSLSREVQELKLVKAASSEQPSYGELKLELIQTRQEVNRAKEALQAMKADRKRLKGEKLDLLNQMKQLYTTLEDKESELRDFIRNYEQRVRESDETIKQLAMEKEECEREKWRIIKKAQEAAERAVILRSQCDTKDQALKKLEVELAELKTQPTDHNKSSTSEADHTTHSVASTIASEELPPYETPSQSDASRDDSFSVKTSTPSHDSRVNSLSNPNKLLNTSHEFPEAESKKKHRIPVFGSLTRMFSKGRLRRSIALPHGETFDDPGHPKLALLSPDNYQEKLAVVNGLKGVHMTNWKANQVLAWLEISLSMPTYGKMCAENIKSGKVLLGLSDSDLGAALGITNSIHRRKLRLAIEEQRDPGEIKYSKAANIDHTWVSHRWLPDLGLPQHSAVFESQLADGRLLNQLSKKDLEKHFSVHRKFHQASILHAIELLRLLNFDKELLSERRSQCEDVNTDPLVWSNERVMKWIKSIELGEYVLNLKESGVHGALMVLEPSFTADTLATALGIPPSKSYLRRHIATELEALIKPARAALDTPNNNTKMRINGTGSVGRSFIRSYRSASLDDGGPKGRLSFRGSLGRAFGRKIKDDLRMTFDSDTTPRSRRGIKISDPIPIQHNHSLDSIVEPDSTTV